MSSFLHLSRAAGTGPAFGVISSPQNVVVQAQALFQILDHAIRHKDGQHRVIGTLLGVRSEDGLEVEIRSAFAVPHEETEDQVTVGVDYNRSMLALHRRANPKDVILGWYATAATLNNLSGLVHDFYSQANGTAPYPAIHMTVQSGNVLADIAVRTYVSSPVGVSERVTGNCLFVPVPNEVRLTEAESGVLDVLRPAAAAESRSVDVVRDIDNLEAALLDVLDMLERVAVYVGQVQDGSRPANAAVGKYLLRTLALMPSVDAGALEKLFNSHLQDVLMLVYLSNSIKTQLELSSRLTPLVKSLHVS